jgi:hypothetical protein
MWSLVSTKRILVHVCKIIGEKHKSLVYDGIGISRISRRVSVYERSEYARCVTHVHEDVMVQSKGGLSIRSNITYRHIVI